MIVPTAFGFAWLVMLLLLWLAAINYQNGLILAFTFALFAIWLLAIHLTHAQLSGLQLQLVAVAAGVAQQAHALDIRLISASGLDQAELQLDTESTWVQLVAGQSDQVRLFCHSPRRGQHPLPLLRVSTRAPWGLFYCACYLPWSSQVTAWPRPECYPSQSEFGQGADGDVATQVSQDGDELSGLQAAQPLAKRQRILWRRYLRTGELVLAQYQQAQPPITLSWFAYPQLTSEQRLSALCERVLQARAQARPVSLQLPNRVFTADGGEAHYQTILEALALYEHG